MLVYNIKMNEMITWNELLEIYTLVVILHFETHYISNIMNELFERINVEIIQKYLFYTFKTIMSHDILNEVLEMILNCTSKPLCTIYMRKKVNI